MALSSNTTLVDAPQAQVVFVTPSSGMLTLVGLRFLQKITNAINGATADSGVSSVTLGTGQQIFSGSGSPNGVVSASPGALYTDTNGGAGATLYVKEVGSDANGWQAK